LVNALDKKNVIDIVNDLAGRGSALKFGAHPIEPLTGQMIKTAKGVHYERASAFAYLGFLFFNYPSGHCD
jgi:hypothetical protein